METSKKLLLFTSIIFGTTLFISVGVFIYSTFLGAEINNELMLTLIATSGAVFGTVSVFYLNKARFENCYKIRKSFLREKCDILQEFQLLNESRIISEIEEELLSIETEFGDEATIANQEITYKE